MKGVIFDIKRFAVHDGPGIRTTVFLRGCPLRCTWCHNPESQGYGVEELPGRERPVRVGREVSVNEVLAEVERDVVFFDESGGGVTFSGGEPLAQPEFLLELLRGCGDLEVHRAVDTSGYAPQKVLLQAAEHTDLFLYDLKMADDAKHREHTSVGVELIYNNLRALCDTDAAIHIRIPVIPGITDTAANMAAIRAFLESLPRKLPVKFLPYHSAAVDKYTRHGMKPPLPDTREPSAEEISELHRALKEK